MKLEAIQEITADVLHVDRREVTEDTLFQEDLGADSLDLFQIAGLAAEKFNTHISADDFRKIRSVRDLMNLTGNC